MKTLIRSVAVVAILIWSGLVGCRERAAQQNVPATSEKPAAGPPVALFFDLDVGATPEDVASLLGHSGRDIGSGLRILHYDLRPRGYAQVAFGFDDRLYDVLLCYATDMAIPLPCSRQGDSPDASQLVRTRERQAGPGAARWPPGVFTEVNTGTGLTELITEIGSPSFREGDLLGYLLAPHGLATVKVTAGDSVESITVFWCTRDCRE